MLQNSETRLTAGLKAFGLTEYEARIYTALSIDFSRSGGASASELSRVSGVAYTKIYSVLDSLAKRGLVELMRGKPALYKQSDPESFFDKWTKEKISSISKAHELVISSLQKLSSQKSLKEHSATEHGASWNIRGKKNVVNRLFEQIARTRESLKLVFPHPNLLDHKLVEKIRSRSNKVETRVLVSRQDLSFAESLASATLRYNDLLESRYALFDDRYSLMIALDTPDYWTGVFETCGNCTRQAYEHFELAWKASRSFQH